ncbi:uncharacterized protein MELLADRAFT_114576 [Melampsora larici-populina 98AG31]|uniref:Uncharacterized protein n=1 Tax=Melampsora larici-populina (strain 98AG31 / pathotype 3-4-7) TaxID=747676 RepID=F4SE04_MELLP|nr:uncharacterized protein MELLADRAFT_114576 [Melampsora larici-populina 98AG31]EGF97121.1 hypothetical protein MELLADRAFT_114576 [Melampsora larici-populina 98AG31]
MPPAQSATLKTGQQVQVGDWVAEIRCSINVQHNCYDSVCQTQRTSMPSAALNSHLNDTKQSVVHKNTDLFIINTAALYNGQAHHEWAQIDPPRVSPEAWAQATHIGLRRWKDSSNKK